MKKSTITINEIAKLAGVSVGTVSRVCNNYGSLSAATIERVKKVMIEHNYKPLERKKNNSGKSQFSGNSKKRRIAFLVPDNFHFAATTQLTISLTNGISKVLAANSSEMIFCQLQPDLSLPYSITHGDIDGIICKNWPKDANVVNNLMKYPHVWCLAIPMTPGLGDQVFCDNYLLGEMLLNYYQERGINKINCFTDLTEIPQRSRFEHIKMIAEHRGMKVYKNTGIDNITIHRSDNGLAGILIDSADFKLIHIYMSLGKQNIDIAKDTVTMCMTISKEQLEAVDKNLILIDLAIEEVGKTAAELLLWRLENSDAPTRRIMIAPSIIEPNLKSYKN